MTAVTAAWRRRTVAALQHISRFTGKTSAPSAAHD